MSPRSALPVLVVAPTQNDAEMLNSTLRNAGHAVRPLWVSSMDAAEKQYHDLKAAGSPTYDFDESELNNLGYEFIRAKKFTEAIHILRLNVEAYPQSSNVYDSLGEAYLDDGNRPQAIVNYKRSLELNPKNRGSVEVLRRLNAQ